MTMSEKLVRGVVVAHGELADLRQQLKQELGASVPSRPRIDELLTEMSGEQARLQGHFVDLMFSMQAALGPEDAKRFQEVLERHLISDHPRTHHARGHHSGSHPPR